METHVTEMTRSPRIPKARVTPLLRQRSQGICEGKCRNQYTGAWPVQGRKRHIKERHKPGCWRQCGSQETNQWQTFRDCPVIKHWKTYLLLMCTYIIFRMYLLSSRRTVVDRHGTCLFILLEKYFLSLSPEKHEASGENMWGLYYQSLWRYWISNPALISI